jgi:uncharacterized protein RhaS with RHS repeats
VSEDPIGINGGVNLYAYAGGDPISATDRSGQIIDTVADAGFIGYDIYRLFKDGRCNLGENWLALGADVLGAALPGVTGLGLELRAVKAARLAANKVAGKAAEARAARELVAEGNRIIGSQVTVQTAAGRRVIDHVIETPDGTIKAIEVKSGNAERSASQKAKDAAAETTGATFKGKNAPEQLRGETRKIKTEERRY